MQTAEPYRGIRIKELPDLSHEEFERLLQEGEERLCLSRKALKENRDKPTPWEDITPASLTPAIKHIRKEFGTKKWQLEMRAECGCYLGLRPHLAGEPKFKGGFDNLIPMERRAAWARVYALAKESQVFKFWSDQFADGLAELIIEPFEAFFKIALAQRSLLDRKPVEWAKAQAGNLIYELSWTLPFKIKEMCDAQQPRADFSTENFGSYCAWMYWRAPRFIHMQPSGNTFYDPETAWEREDAEKTESLLRGLSSRMLDHPRFKLDSLAGQAYVGLACFPVEERPAKIESRSAASQSMIDKSTLDLPRIEPGKNKQELPPKKTDLSKYFNQAGLTDRQRECASLRHEYALTVTAIAERLGLSRKTVDEHLVAAERRIESSRARDRAQAHSKHRKDD